MSKLHILEVQHSPSRTRIIFNSYRYFDIAFQNILKIKYLKPTTQNESLLQWLNEWLEGELTLEYDFLAIESEISKRVDAERSKIVYNITAGCNKEFAPVYKKIGKKRFQDFFLGFMAQALVEYQNTVYAFNFGRSPII